MCGKAFASATNYKNHIRIHSGEKPYVCSIENCGRRFTEYSSLYKHHLVSILNYFINYTINNNLLFIIDVKNTNMQWD